MKRRFEEILEECLSAQLEGRRSVEDSLSLYPSLALELEPLLRTAANVAYAYEGLNPPPYLLERGRLRFVAAASERRSAREIARGVWGFGRTRMPWNIRHWGMLGAGVAAACALVLVGAVALMSGGGDDGGSAVDNPATTAPAEFVTNLEELQRQLNRVTFRTLLGRVTIADIEDLRQATTRLAESGQPPDDAARETAEKLLNEQYVLSFTLGETATLEQRDELQDELQELASVTQKAANTLDVDLSTPTPVATEPVASETPVDTATPTEAPTPTAPATETPAPTEAPTPTPTPPLQGVE